MKLKLLHLLIFFIALIAGIFVMAQWRTPPARVLNPVTPYISLTKSRDELTQKQERQKQDIKNLQEEKTRLQKELKNQQKISQANIEELNKLKELVGLTELSGEGIEIIMDDSPKVKNTDSIVHAADLRDLVNFLWLAGSSALSINNERLVTTTSIDCIVNTILINSTKLTPPFLIRARGEPTNLLALINDKNNFPDIHRRADNGELLFQAVGRDNLTWPAYNGSFNLEFSQINDH